MNKQVQQIRSEIDARRQNMVYELYGLPEDDEKYIRVKGMHDAYVDMLAYIDYHIPEQPVSNHHEIEVAFRGEKVTINREFYRDGEKNYSTSEQDDNAIWSALRAWCEKKGITPFELYPKQPEQPVSEGLEEAAENYIAPIENDEGLDYINFNGRDIKDAFIAGAEWQKNRNDLETADLLAIAHLQGMEQQKSKMLEDAVEGVAEELYNDGESQCTVGVGTYFKPGEEVYVIKKED